MFFLTILSNACTNSIKKIVIPFKSGQKFIVTQGAFGTASHNEKGNEHSWDLSVPYGTQVSSVDSGTVIKVWEPNKGGACNPKFSNLAHNVKIEHSDGTVAQYVHIKSKVKEGQKVKRGQVIAITANNGWICNPHLHFGIYQSKDHLYSSTKRKTIPLSFIGIRKGKLKEGLSYISP